MKAYELLDSPEKWTKGVMARDANGEHVLHDSPNAVCWCMLGAIERCLNAGGAARVRDVLEARGLGRSISGFNDSTDYETMLSVLKEADA